MSSPDHSPLGKATVYADRYDAGLLYPIPRQGKRDEIGVSADALPFHGVDVWNGYELSWLDLRGKPVVTVAEFRRFVKATGHVTVAERAPDAADFPDADPALLVPGSLVFHPTRGPVDLSDVRNWWSYVPGASWEL